METIEQMKQVIEAMKKELKPKMDGKLMIRQNKRYKGQMERGIFAFDFYYDVPTPKNQELIIESFKHYGFYCGQSKPRIQGGLYGFIFTFWNKRA